jgi:hypothetical protein
LLDVSIRPLYSLNGRPQRSAAVYVVMSFKSSGCSRLFGPKPGNSLTSSVIRQYRTPSLTDDTAKMPVRVFRVALGEASYHSMRLYTVPSGSRLNHLHPSQQTLPARRVLDVRRLAGTDLWIAIQSPGGPRRCSRREGRHTAMRLCDKGGNLNEERYSFCRHCGSLRTSTASVAGQNQGRTPVAEVVSGPDGLDRPAEHAGADLAFGNARRLQLRVGPKCNQIGDED